MLDIDYLPVFLRATASTAVAHLSHRNSVHMSVYHTGGSVENDASKNQQIFTVDCLRL